MPTLTLDVVLFSVFLATNLVLGLLVGRKVKTLRVYAIGHKNFSTATVTATIIATWVGGGFFFYALANIYTTGLQFIFVTLGGSLSPLLTGQVLAVRMKEFLNNLSVAEAMGHLYGSTVRILIGIGGIILSIGYLAIQFQVIGKMLTFILGLQGPSVTVVAAIIVIVYSAFGGIRSVTITDIFQFITFSISIPILALIIWNNLKDPGQVIHTLTTNPIFSFKEVIGWNPQFMGAIGLFFFFAIPSLQPAVFQRIAMAKDLQQVKKSFTYTAGILLLIVMTVAWIAILLLTDNPNLAPEKLVNYLIEHYAYPGLKGMIAIGITAMAMSTADSHLNAAAVLGIHDILKPLKLFLKPSLTSARVFSGALGMVSLVLALHTQDILKIGLLVANFYMPIVCAPFLLAIFGFRSSPRAVLLGMGAGIITAILWRTYFTYTGLDSSIPGMLGNLLFFIASHYLLKEKGGWVGIQAPGPLLAARQRRRAAWQNLIKTLQHPKPYAYLKKNLPTQEYLYFLFGLYIIGATYASFYTIAQEAVATFQKLYDHIAHTVLIAAAAFLTYPVWPLTFRGKRFIAFAWPIGIGYILFFIGSVLVVMSGFHQVQVMIFMLNLVLAALLLDWPLMICLVISGVLLACGAFQCVAGAVPLTSVVQVLQFRVLYGLPLFVSFLIALVRFREAKQKLTFKNRSLQATHEETSKELLGTYKDRKRFTQAFRTSGATDLAQIAILSKKIVDNTKDLNLPQKTKQEITQLHEKVRPIALYLDKLDHRAASYLQLETATITIDALLEAIQKKLRTKELHKYLRWKKLTQHQEVECDVTRIVSLMVNSIAFMQTVAREAAFILIGIEDTQLGYPICAIQPNYTKKIAALRITMTSAQTLPALEALYFAQMREDTSPMPETTTDLPLVANERIVKAHYGYTSTLSTEKALTQVYVIPVQLREVRPKDMDLPEMELGAKLTRSNDTYPEAQEQEAAFLKAVQERTKADLKQVQAAIEFIKQYHGPVNRSSGEPFYLHPIAVAHLVLEYNQDEATVLAALLHDTIEDTSLTADQIAIRFSQEVSDIVKGVTHLNTHKETFYKVKLSPQENTRMLLASSDQRVLYVKLADRLHNMLTIQHKPYASQRHTAEETLLVYVPLAHKLGLAQAAATFKELCFKVLTQKPTISDSIGL